MSVPGTQVLCLACWTKHLSGSLLKSQEGGANSGLSQMWKAEARGEEARHHRSRCGKGPAGTMQPATRSPVPLENRPAAVYSLALGLQAEEETDSISWPVLCPFRITPGHLPCTWYTPCTSNTAQHPCPPRRDPPSVTCRPLSLPISAPSSLHFLQQPPRSCSSDKLIPTAGPLHLPFWHQGPFTPQASSQKGPRWPPQCPPAPLPLLLVFQNNHCLLPRQTFT